MNTVKNKNQIAPVYQAQCSTTATDMHLVRIYSMNEKAFEPICTIPEIQVCDYHSPKHKIQSDFIPVDCESFVAFERDIKSAEMRDNPNLDRLINKF